MPDKTYLKFLETLASCSHPTRKYHEIELMFFKKFYNRFHKVEDNPRNLRPHPNDFKMSLMWEQYIGERKDDA
jgi:hypothetical protein